MPGTVDTNLYGSGWANSGPLEIGNGISRRLVMAIDDQLWNISPAQTPFLVMLNKISRSSVPQPRYEWQEDADFNIRSFKCDFVVSRGANDAATWLKLRSPSDLQGLESVPYWQSAASYDVTDLLLYKLTIDDGGVTVTAWIILEKNGVENAGQWRTIDVSATPAAGGDIPLDAAIDVTIDPVGYFIMIGATDGAATFNFSSLAAVDSVAWHHDTNGSIKSNECVILDTVVAGRDGVIAVTGAPSLVAIATDNDFTPAGGAGTAEEHDCYVQVYTPDMFQQGYFEGAGLPQESHRGFNMNYGLTQIFKTPYSITETARATQYQGPDEWMRKKVRKTRQHKLDMEQAFIFQGVPTIDDPYSDSPRRTSGGLGLGITVAANAGYIRTFNPDIIGATSHSDSALMIDDTASTFFSHMNDMMELIFEDHVIGSDEKILLHGSKWATMAYEAGIDSSGFQWRPSTTRNETFGFAVSTLVGPHGTLRMVRHPFFRGYWENYGLILDPANISYRFLRDTKLVPNSQANDADAYQEYLITEAGLQVKHEQTHAICKLY